MARAARARSERSGAFQKQQDRGRGAKGGEAGSGAAGAPVDADADADANASRRGGGLMSNLEVQSVNALVFSLLRLGMSDVVALEEQTAALIERHQLFIDQGEEGD